MTEFKDRLRGMRCERRLTQAELASRAGVNRAMVWNWEHGINYPTLSNAMAVADALGCSLDQLAGRE